MRGVRGAITVETDETGEILAAARELLEAILTANPTLRPQDIAAVFFTATADLSAAFPAQAARQMGWTAVPMICAAEIPVPGSLPKCVRVMLLWNTDLPQNEIRHCYLRGAVSLRPDLAGNSPLQEE